MDDRSVQYNNAGVSVLMMENGHHVIAMELFRGALESKLAFERSQLVADDACDCDDEQPHHSPEVSLEDLAMPAPAGCVAQAESHLQNLESYLSATTSPVSQEVADTINRAISVPRQSRGYDPYICKTPMSIQDRQNATQLTSSMIVYNLGLVHQLVNRESPAVAVFYEISVSLMPHASAMTSEASLFRLSLLNNFGVWCFENGDGECMRICMEQLAVSLEELDREHVPIDASTRQGVQSNIQWLLTPLNGGSPAA